MYMSSFMKRMNSLAHSYPITSLVHLIIRFSSPLYMWKKKQSILINGNDLCGPEDYKQ